MSQAFWLALDPRLRDSDFTTPQTVDASKPSLLFSSCEVYLYSAMPAPAVHATTPDEVEDRTLDEPGTPSSSKPPRATVKNPIYGLVEGVKRGNTRIGKYHAFGYLRHLMPHC
jgi:hypothetical protein